MGNLMKPIDDVQTMKKRTISFSQARFMENNADTKYCTYENEIIKCNGAIDEKLYETVKSYYIMDPELKIEKYATAYFHDTKCINKVVITNDNAEWKEIICIHLI
jgi:hypothetical protein